MNRTTYRLIAAAGFITLLGTDQNVSADPTVTVANPPTNPAHTSSVDDPGRIPYQFFKNLQPCSGTVCQVITPPVPQGKRLVVLHVSAFGSYRQSSFFQVVVSTNSAMLSTFAPQMLNSPSGTGTGFAFDQAMLGYADAGSAVTVLMSINGSFDNTATSVTVTGYLLDCAMNQCAATTP
jgi:hypothetical protein